MADTFNYVNAAAFPVGTTSIPSGIEAVQADKYYEDTNIGIIKNYARTVNTYTNYATAAMYYDIYTSKVPTAAGGWTAEPGRCYWGECTNKSVYTAIYLENGRDDGKNTYFYPSGDSNDRCVVLLIAEQLKSNSSGDGGKSYAYQRRQCGIGIPPSGGQAFMHWENSLCAYAEKKVGFVTDHLQTSAVFSPFAWWYSNDEKDETQAATFYMKPYDTGIVRTLGFGYNQGRYMAKVVDSTGGEISKSSTSYPEVENMLSALYTQNITAITGACYTNMLTSISSNVPAYSFPTDNSSHRNIYGTYGCLLEKVAITGNPTTIQSYAPSLYLNAADCSYYIRTAVRTANGVQNVTGFSYSDVYFPSHRFYYDYSYDDVNPFCTKVTFGGYKPVPIEIPDGTSDDLTENIRDAESGAIVRVDYEKENCPELPAVIQNTDGYYYSGCVTSGATHVAVLKNIDGFLPSGVVDRKVIKSADFYYLATPDSTATPNVVTRLYNRASDYIFQQKNRTNPGLDAYIKPENTSRLAEKNLYNITGLSIDDVGNNDTSKSTYELNYNYVVGDDVYFCHACNGRVTLRRNPGSNNITGVYADGNTDIGSTESGGNSVYSIPTFDSEKGYLQNIIVDHSGNSFEVFKLENSYYSMLYSSEMADGMLDRIRHFITESDNPQAPQYGKLAYFGAGTYDDIAVEATDSLGSWDRRMYEGDLTNATYIIDDSIDWDVKITPELTEAQRTIVTSMFGSGVNVSELISSSVVGKWFIWLDKSSNDVGSSIKIEVLDCRGRKSDGDWVEYHIDDVTEKLVKNNEYVGPNDVDFDVDSDEAEVNRIKIRFRLYCDDDSVYLKENGYRIVLGYRVVGANGQIKNFTTHYNKANPYPKLCNNIVDENTGEIFVGGALDRQYHVFIKGKSDYNKTRNGVVYDKDSISPNDNDVKVSMDVVIYNEAGLRTRESRLIDNWWSGISKNISIYPIDNHETGSGSIGGVGLYYVVVSWVESGFVVDNYTNIKVRHRVGSYYRYMNQSDYCFSMGGNDSIQFKDRYSWDNDNKKYVLSDWEDHPEYTVDEKTVNSTNYWYPNNEPLSIYDLWDDSGLQQYKLKVRYICESGDLYNICVGKTDRVSLSFDSSDETDLVINPDWFETDSSGDKFIRIYVTKNYDHNKVPDFYESYTITASGIRYDKGYYEINGGFGVKFSEYGTVNVVGTVYKNPEISNGYFYIVNGVKMFGFGATYQISGQKSGSNGISVQKIETKWGIECLDDKGNSVWNTGDGYVSSINDNLARFRVAVVKDAGDVGTLPYHAMFWKLRFYGEYVMVYDVYVDNKVVHTVRHRGIQPLEGSFDPINVAVEPQMYFMNPVIGYHDVAVLINETDNTNNAYMSYDFDLDCGVSWNNIPSDVKMIRQRMNFSQDVESIGSVRGKLNSASGLMPSRYGDNVPWYWNRNDEGIEWVSATNHPVLYAVNKTDYKEGVNRVIDGQKLKYPYSRTDILISPNEWLTADNINRRFDMIEENLKYLANQTKVYSKPPLRYCGYYGDFIANDNGTYGRLYGGYVPVLDKALYRKYSEVTSIDDEHTTFRGIKSMCVDVGDYDLDDVDAEPGESYEEYTDECADNNMYVCLGDRIKIVNSLTYIQNLARADIVPKKINEFMNDISRIAYSVDTGLLYCLSTKTHKVYIFNQYKNIMVGDPQNASYYGEIGGYGGPQVNNKFNNPTDLFISTVKEKNGGKHDEMWVCDTGNNVIKHYTIKGQWINTIDLSVLDDFKVISVCSDYNNKIFVMTETHVFVFDPDGVLLYVFELHEKLLTPKLIRPQFNAEFLYVLYDHFVAKYTTGGEYVTKFAEHEELTYASMCADRKHNLYIGTNKNILHYCDGLRLMELGQTENADDFKWKPEEIHLKRDENIQDSVLNTSLQRVYDNIQMYSVCIFGRIIDVVSDLDEDRVSDVDYVTRNNILAEHHKERIFVGINELVTSDTINRSFGLMYDLLEKILASI